MAYESYPFGDQSVTDEQFRRWARTFAGTAVHEGLGVSANSTGMNVQIAAGFATVQGMAFHNDATATIMIDGNTASNPRIDTVVLRLTQGTSVVPAVVKGVPRANPVPPTLTQTDTGTFEFPLADVAVPASAVSIPSTAITSRVGDNATISPAGGFKTVEALTFARSGNIVHVRGVIKPGYSIRCDANDAFIWLPYAPAQNALIPVPVLEVGCRFANATLSNGSTLAKISWWGSPYTLSGGQYFYVNFSYQAA